MTDGGYRLLQASTFILKASTAHLKLESRSATGDCYSYRSIHPYYSAFYPSRDARPSNLPPQNPARVAPKSPLLHLCSVPKIRLQGSKRQESRMQRNEDTCHRHAAGYELAIPIELCLPQRERPRGCSETGRCRRELAFRCITARK